MTGCKDPDVPSHSWVKREADIALVGCKGRESPTWKLKCHEGIWFGYKGNCSTTCKYCILIWAASHKKVPNGLSRFRLNLKISLDFLLFFLQSRCHTKRSGRAPPSFGMTTTQDISSGRVKRTRQSNMEAQVHEGIWFGYKGNCSTTCKYILYCKANVTWESC